MNVLIGKSAGTTQTTQNANTFIGDYCGWSSTGYNNTFVGQTSGYGLSSGYNNTGIGKDAGYTGSPSGNITTANNIICIGNDSNTASYVKVDWTVTSDRRDKTDITPFTHGLSWINKLNPVTYRWDNRSFYENGIPDGSKKQQQLNIGLIAQDEIEVEKEHGYGDTSENMIVSHVNIDGNYGMQYSRLVPILINAVKELSAKVAALEAA
jgi:hypothetical protein